MKSLAQLKDASVEELEREIGERRQFIGKCVGQLYPSILEDEIFNLNEMVRVKKGGAPRVQQQQSKKVTLIHEGEVLWSDIQDDELGSLKFFDVDDGESNLSTVATTLKEGTKVRVTIEVLE